MLVGEARMMATLRADSYSEPLVTFDDVLIVPSFSDIASRKDVDLTTTLGNIKLKLPVMSANMDTITEEHMAVAIERAGGLGILHRFCDIDKNVKLFKNSRTGSRTVGVSVGVGDAEKERALALVSAGADIICVDVAHGAQQSVVQQVVWIRETFKDNVQVIVGNFATSSTIREFMTYLNINKGGIPIFKVGIGPGSACTTRIKTGVGIPQLSAIMDCFTTGYPIIADGGMRYPGDIAKALAAGAKAVMLGGMLAATDETPIAVELVQSGLLPSQFTSGITYRGSASVGYGNGWKTSEGVSLRIPYKGPVEPILKDIEGGLRSAFTYVGANNLDEFKERAKFVRVSSTTRDENEAHGARS
jgi:IMP dehydrogenase